MIKFILTIFLLFLYEVSGDIFIVDSSVKTYDLLPSTQIYIDKTKKLTISDVKSKNIKFKNTDESVLSYGYSPDFNVWIKFTLKNNSDNTIHKILEYGNPLSNKVTLFNTTDNIVFHDGLSNININRKSINPIFNISLEANESKTYYIKASSYITTLIIKLKIWNNNSFYNHELKHQFILALFFGAMTILALYNLFIYLFSRDISYLWYAFYIFGVIIHHLMYVGIAYIYIIDKTLIPVLINYSSFIVAFPIVILTLFLKSFLKIYKYKVLNYFITSYIIFIPISIIIFISDNSLIKYRNSSSILLVFILICITIFLTWKRNRQAYFIFCGWTSIFVAIILMYFSSIGLFNVYNKFPYFIEVSFLLEAVIFAIALSDKINILQKETIIVSQELIIQKETENLRLEIQIQNKTKDLNISLTEKTLLLQELNHRVKNNMQLIISLIRLQTNDIDDKKIQSLFITTQNRINAMSQLHELLYQESDILYINAMEYFSSLIEGLQETYTQNIHINYEIDIDLETEKAFSCGIILNELVTNSLKYAYINNYGEINIYLSKELNIYTLVVKDKGIGYDKDSIKKSFGLTLVKTLVESKLEGSIIIDTKVGVNTKITWSEDD